MALRARRFFNVPGKIAPDTSARDAERYSLGFDPNGEDPIGAFHGLLVALLLAAPFWVALYFLLR